MRSTTGGYGLKIPFPGPRMLSPRVVRGVPDAPALFESFKSADASEAGLPLILPLIRSARYSRSRCSAGSKNLLKGSKNMTREKTRENTLNSAS